MKHPEFTVSAIIFNNRGEILLCRSHKWDDKYIIPGGHVEFGETMEDALRREIREETGLEIHTIKPIGLKECFYNNRYYKDRHFLFMDYTCRSDSTDVILNEEAQEYAWVSPDRLKDYELGGFTESLLEKLDSGEDDPHRQSIFYNY